MESALNNQHISATQPSVAHEQNLKQVAHAALKQVPGGTDFVNNYFSAEAYNHQQIPMEPFKNLVQHPRFGAQH